MDTDTRLLPLGAMARQLHVPAKWLREEAAAGRIPHLRAGNVLLFNPAVVEPLLIERASAATHTTATAAGGGQ